MTRRATERLRLPVHPRRRRWKPLIVTLVALALLIGGAAAFYSWTQTQYFVGKDGSEVAIFRGVNTQFGPIKFFEVQENTDLKLGHRALRTLRHQLEVLLSNSERLTVDRIIYASGYRADLQCKDIDL